MLKFLGMLSENQIIFEKYESVLRYCDLFKGIDASVFKEFLLLFHKEEWPRDFKSLSIILNNLCFYDLLLI